MRATRTCGEEHGNESVSSGQWHSMPTGVSVALQADAGAVAQHGSMTHHNRLWLSLSRPSAAHRPRCICFPTIGAGGGVGDALCV